jgi:hypothetical protein
LKVLQVDCQRNDLPLEAIEDRWRAIELTVPPHGLQLECGGCWTIVDEVRGRSLQRMRGTADLVSGA